MIFLAQIYAPYEEDSNNFHRTVFVFMCKQSTCFALNKSENFVAFRNQLNRENKFYPYEPPVEVKDSLLNPKEWTKLCSVCGCKGPKKCAQCKKVTYCSRDHQVVDWKFGHKVACKDDASESQCANPSTVLFPEYEIVTEPEDDDSNKNDKDDIEAREMAKYEEMKKKGKTGTLDTVEDVTESDLQAHATVDKDKTFTKFKKQVDLNPNQVIRYHRGGDPLWIASEPKLKPEEVPLCQYCNGSRQFEFQIMPQMICSLKDDSIDWGILNVYTCKQSCTNGNAYKKEFIFKQDVSA